MKFKKYKPHFSIFNIIDGTQPEMAKFKNYIKAATAAVTSMTWYNSDAKYAIIVGITGMIIDTLLDCIYLEKIEE